MIGPENSEKGGKCPVICNAHCHNETQLECDGGKDDDGCQMQNTCVERGHGVNAMVCPGFCPEECNDMDNKCEVGRDPVTDCAVPARCIPKQINNNNEPCSEQHCPVICKVTEHLCRGDVLLDGCMEGDTCVPKGVSGEGETCPGTCPVTCENGWIKCDGQVNYVPPYTHCIDQDICHVKAKNENGLHCMDSSASHGCPKTCPPDEVLCPPSEGALGCLEEAVCKPKSKDNRDNYCPSTSDCPTVCKHHEVNCPGGTGDDGCKNPDLCIEQHRDFHGDICPVHCPQVCDDDQVFCPGQRNPINGCYGSDQCKDKGTHKWGETQGAACPGWCPAICNEHEVLCDSAIDPCNGCPTEEVCREAIKDFNGIFCPGKEFTVQEEGEDYRDNGMRRGGYLSASHNCPVYCREDIGEVQCPVYEDELGCKPEAACTQRTKTSDGKEWCPSTSVCPKQCAVYQKLCHYEDKDRRGCNVEDVCVSIDTDNEGNACDMDWCPPICTADQRLKESGDDENGCRRSPYCGFIVD